MDRGRWQFSKNVLYQKSEENRKERRCKRKKRTKMKEGKEEDGRRVRRDRAGGRREEGRETTIG